MQKKNTVTFRVCTLADAPSLSDFLWSMRAEFHFSTRDIVAEVTSLLFDKGGAIAGYVDRGDVHGLDADDGEVTGTMIGMFGYFCGEPSRGYVNKEVGFVYIAGIAKHFRHAGVFIDGLHFLARTLQAIDVTEVRCHAREDDAYTNRLYARLAHPIGKEKNRRGDTCILYATSMENVLVLTNRHRKSKIGSTLELAIAS